MIIEIVNWDGYQQRKDVKHCFWFRLSHELIFDHEFYDFTGGEFKAWIYLLSLASKTNKAKILINYEHAEQRCRLSQSDINGAVEKLVRNQCIRVQRNEDVTSTSRTRNVNVTADKKRLDKKKNMSAFRQTYTPEFEIIWKQYSRVCDKKEAFDAFRNLNLSPDDLTLLALAIDRYKQNEPDKKWRWHLGRFLKSDWRVHLDSNQPQKLKTLDDLMESSQ